MATQEKHTLVLGASTDASRYSHLAVQKLLAHGHTVTAIGRSAGTIGPVSILTGTPIIEGLHTVSLYLNPVHQEALYSYILSLKPQRIIFNPGTENDVLATMAKAQGITVKEACTLVMLGTGQY
jgi:uncharacterized protein